MTEGGDAEELERLRRAVDATRLLIIVVDARGYVERVNRAVEVLTGLPQEALRKPIWELAALPSERMLIEANFGPRGSGHPPAELLFHLASVGGPTPAVDWTVDAADEPGRKGSHVLAGLDVSKHLVADERLRQTDELRRLILDRLPAVVWMTDRELRFTLGGGGGLTPLGLAGDQLALLGTSLFGYFHTEDRTHPAIAAHLRGLQGERSTFQMTWNERTYEARIEPLRDHTQAIVGCVGIAFDVTEQDRAARALAESEARLRRLVESDIIGVLFWTSQGQILEANTAFLQLVGYTRDELLSGALSWRGMTPEEYRLLDDRALAELAATGRCDPLEKELVSKNGQRVPVLVGAAAFDPPRDGELSGVAFILDLREQVRLRAARDELLVQEQAARMETEVANSRLMLLVEGSKRLARTLKIEDTLRAFAELAVPALADWSYVAHRGHDGNEWIVASAHGDPSKRDLLRHLHGCRPDLEAPDGAPRAFRTGEMGIYEDITIERLAPRGAQWSVVGTRDPEHLHTLRELGMRSLMCVPIRGRVGVEAVAMLVSATDPHRYGHEDVLLAQDLAGRAAVALENGRLLAEALDAIQARDTFLTVAAHELRTPLTSLLLQVETSRRALEGRSDAKTAIRGIRSTEVQARKLSMLIDSLLDVTRLRTGWLTIQAEEIDIAQVVLDTAATMAPDAERAGCTVDVTVPGKVVGRWDRARIEQVLRNLLSNAMKFGARRPIEVRVETTADGVEVSVRDHGAGLTHEDQLRIFGRFERAVSARHFGGLGLGLYISAQILRAHGGSLRVESEPGQGALFIVHLPWSSEAASTPTAEPHQGSSPPPPS